LVDEVGSNSRLIRWELLAVLLIVVVPAWVTVLDQHGQALSTTLGESVVRISGEIGTMLLVAYLLRDVTSWRASILFGRTRWLPELGWSLLLLGLLWALNSLYQVAWLALDLPLPPPPTYPSEPLLPLALLSSAAFEEVVFRGYLLIRLTPLLGGAGRALLVTVVLFTLCHDYPLVGQIGVAITGLTLGASFVIQRQLPRLVLAHWFFNLSVAAP
tara:strand:- start:158 stop:802 length:645 start_codon:yes stop_codon:yes gene_type:complete